MRTRSGAVFARAPREAGVFGCEKASLELESMSLHVGVAQQARRLTVAYFPHCNPDIPRPSASDLAPIDGHAHCEAGTQNCHGEQAQVNGATEIEMQRWSRGLRVAPIIWITLACVSVVALLLWLRGADFYHLPLSERVDHSDYHVLSPSRPVGRVYGAVGLLLMLVNLSYLLRRRFAHLPLGHMRLWLDSHVVTGLTATLFVAFHSAFQLRSPVAMVTALTLGVTVTTGVIGRFFYALVPRTESALRERLFDLEGLLPGLRKQINEALAALPPHAPPAGSGLWRVFRTLPGWFKQARTRQVLVISMCRQRAERASPLDREQSAPLSREVAKLAASEVYAVAARELLRAWRPWHRLSALIMISGVLLHVGVALFYGYGWDFRS